MKQKYVVCIDNRDYEASLETGKLYRTVPDPNATTHDYIRIIDESGEDYAYSSKRFFPIEVPKALEEALLQAA